MNDAINSQQEPDAVRAAVQSQIIECLNRFYAMESGMWASRSTA